MAIPREIPFIRLLLPLSLGITAGLCSDGVPLAPIFVIAALSLLFMAVRLFVRRVSPDPFFGVAVSLLMLSGGYILIRAEMRQAEEYDLSEAIYICRLKKFPEKRSRSYALTAEILAVIKSDSTTVNRPAGIIVYHTFNDSADAQSMLPGDIIAVRMNPMEITNRGNPYEFDYQSFMLKRGIRYYAFSRDQALLEHTSGVKRDIRERALITGRRIYHIYEKAGIEQGNIELLSALTLGRRDLVESDTREAFATAGVIHIMAVSGLHAGVISMFVFAILFFLKGRLMVLRVIVSVVVLWSFAFITGLPPSVERASLMFTFLHTGRLLKRPVNSLNSILAAAFFMLIFKPSDLTQLSFQLSFSAVLFISGFFYRANRVVKTGITAIDRVSQIAVVSVLAQLGTLPFTLNAFGRFPIWFLPANIIIIPLASLIIILAALLIVISPLPFLPEAVAAVLNLLLHLAKGAAGAISELPGAAGGGFLITGAEMVTLLFLNWAFLYTLLVMKRKSLVLPLVAVLLFTASQTVHHITTAVTSEVLVYNIVGEPPLPAIRSGKRLYLFTGAGTDGDVGVSLAGHDTNNPISRHISLLRLNPVLLSSDTGIITVHHNGKEIVIDSRQEGLLYHYSISPDILLLPHRPVTRTDTDICLSCIIVAGKSGRPPRSMFYREASAENGALHIVERDGAWIKRLPGASFLTLFRK